LVTPRWRVRLSEPAEQDFRTVLEWTAEHFGRRQTSVYRSTLIAALTALHNGPLLPGSAARDEVRPGLRSLHIAREGHRGRHFVLYKVAEPGVIDIVRILHDAMDLARHLRPDASAPDA
jgi:toxin ParE1/3/4